MIVENDYKVASTKSLEKSLDSNFVSENSVSFLIYIKNYILENGLSQNQYNIISDVINQMISDYEDTIKNTEGEK